MLIFFCCMISNANVFEWSKCSQQDCTSRIFKKINNLGFDHPLSFSLSFIKMMKLIVYLSVLLPILFLQERGLIRDVLLYLHAFCIPFIITSSSSNDLYGLKHFIFNLELPPRTLWFNMGFWESPNATFPEACAHLVKTVIKNMNLNRESNVLGWCVSIFPIWQII
jgi:hypothetical protein